MKRRNCIKVIASVIMSLLLPKSKRIVGEFTSTEEVNKYFGFDKSIKEISKSHRLVIAPNENGNFSIVRGKIGQVLFVGEWLKWNDPDTLVFTNKGWIPVIAIKGRLDYFGIKEAIMSCYGHPELAGKSIPSGLHEAIIHGT